MTEERDVQRECCKPPRASVAPAGRLAPHKRQPPMPGALSGHALEAIPGAIDDGEATSPEDVRVRPGH